MKKMLLLILLLVTLTLLVSSAAFAAVPQPQTRTLSVGTMQVYDFGSIKLHAYETKDPLADESFLLETADAVVGIESPTFKGNLDEYAAYIKELGKPMKYLLLPYHPSGAANFADAAVYGTATSKKAQGEGGQVKGLVDSFTQVFGPDFDANMPQVTHIMKPGSAQVGGINFVVAETADGFDLEIPAINAVFTHMFGTNVHNILTGIPQIDAMAAQARGYQAKKFDLILSSHHTSETIDVAATKLAYLVKTKEIAKRAKNGADFIAQMKAAFPGYAGENYLEMSAGALFGGK